MESDQHEWLVSQQLRPSAHYLAYAGNASADVLPVANTLQFITNAVQQSFVLSVLPDDVPELDEVSGDHCRLQ